jgi:hypothetical protein
MSPSTGWWRPTFEKTLALNSEEKARNHPRMFPVIRHSAGQKMFRKNISTEIQNSTPRADTLQFCDDAPPGFLLKTPFKLRNTDQGNAYQAIQEPLCRVKLQGLKSPAPPARKTVPLPP